MRYTFKTLDDTLFVIDTKAATWGIASTILAAPSVIAAAESKLANYVFSEQGTLVPMGGGRYSLDGRTPKTQGKGAGLSTVGILSVPFDTDLFLYLLPNAPVKEDSFQSGFPEEMQKYVKHEVRQPEQAKEMIAKAQAEEKAEAARIAAEALQEETRLVTEAENATGRNDGLSPESAQ